MLLISIGPANFFWLMLAGVPLLLEATAIKTGRSRRNHWNSQGWEWNQRFATCYYDFSDKGNKSKGESLNFCTIHSSYGYENATRPRVWYFPTQALWSFIVAFDSTGIVRLHVALPQRQLSKALLSQLWVTGTASGAPKSSEVLMIPGLCHPDEISPSQGCKITRMECVFTTILFSA